MCRSHESDQLKGVLEESINIASYVICHANNGCHFLSVSHSFSISFLFETIVLATLKALTAFSLNINLHQHSHTACELDMGQIRI